MKNTHLSKKVHHIHNNASIDLPSHRIWVSLEEYSPKSSLDLKTGSNFKQVKKAEVLMDQAFDSILEKLVRQS